MIIIKVIQNNFNKTESIKEKQTTIHTFCDECNSELELTPEDTHIGWLGAAFVTCPCCGEETMVEEAEGVALNKDNIEFPLHFQRCNKNIKHVKEVFNEEITVGIRKGIEWFRCNKDEYYWYTSYGDLFVIIFRYTDDEEYFVVVTKDFYNACVPFEKGDY